MDILAHGLWTGALYKGANLKTSSQSAQGGKEKKLNVRWAIFWGIFPDLFAFSIPFVWFVFELLTGQKHFSDIPHPGSIEPDGKPKFFGDGDIGQAKNGIAELTAFLYSLSHSLAVFAIVALLVFLYWRLFLRSRRLPWEMGGWLFHISLDVPTHTYQFFPTPVFWPLGGWRFHGYSWAHPLFQVVNYSLIIITYLVLYYYEKKKKKTADDS